jgi:hypothetical protein
LATVLSSRITVRAASNILSVIDQDKLLRELKAVPDGRHPVLSGSPRFSS